ncbi:MAG: type IV pilus modification PilV family protein [Candidatus Muiribacteriota bacterium]
MHKILFKKGFTLLQVLVALVILALAITSIFAMNAINTRRLRENRLYLSGLTVASDILEGASSKKFVSENLNSELIFNSNDKHGLLFDTEFLEEHNGKVRVNIVENDKNVSHVLLELRYQNVHSRETYIILRSGVFNEVY